ncbi:hypothetical protein Syun_009196 [Stephania yunnanensis]|uniref:Uncharacterized protein n=1 Tax=Stephania yunnanensis TaxID=152371 RepID=A0AAP0KGH5_9MAGN
MRERREQFRLFWGFGVVLAFSEERERERDREIDKSLPADRTADRLIGSIENS